MTTKEESMKLHVRDELSKGEKSIEAQISVMNQHNSATRRVSIGGNDLVKEKACISSVGAFKLRNTLIPLLGTVIGNKKVNLGPCLGLWVSKNFLIISTNCDFLDVGAAHFKLSIYRQSRLDFHPKN